MLTFHLQVAGGDEINANPVGQRVAAAVDRFWCVEGHRVNAEDGRPAEEELDDDDAQHDHDTSLTSLDGLKVGVDAQCLLLLLLWSTQTDWPWLHTATL